MRHMEPVKSVATRLYAIAALLALGSSLLPATLANASDANYTFADAVESTTVQTPLCQTKTVVCNDTFSFGFLGKTLEQGKKDLPFLEASVKFKTNLTGWFQDFSEPLDVKQIQASSKAGQTAIITWEPQKIGDKVPDNYPLKKIIAGSFDKYLIASAKLAKSAGNEFVIRFAHEMNGYWYPWGIAKPGDPRSLANETNTPQTYIKAYRHVHDVFKSQGVRNVKWMWSPNLIDATPQVELSTLYPGDDYVDVVGLSGYLRSTQLMEERFRPTFDQLDQVAPTKPIIIAEGGVDHTAQRDLLTKDLLSGLAREPRVQGFLWLNKIAEIYDYSLAPDDKETIAAIKDSLSLPAVRTTPSYKAVVAMRASITGEAVVGATLSAQGNYKGQALSTRYSWLRCPTATSDVSACENVGVGPYHVLTEDDRHGYLQATLAVRGLSGYDFSRSSFFGPILSPQLKATLPAAYTRGTSTQLVFEAAPANSTHVVVKLNSSAPVFLPASTKEYWFTNLAIGSAHTFTISYADLHGTGKLIGEATTGSFTASSAISAPKLTVFGDVLTVGLSTAAVGQTAWRYQIDNEAITTISPNVTSFNSTNLSIGAHSVSLWAISGDASTLVKTYGFSVLPTPEAPQISIQSGAAWLTFAPQPSGIKSIMIYVNDRSPITLAAYGVSTYKITDLTNRAAHKITLRYSLIDSSQSSIGLGRESKFTLIPVPSEPTGKVESDGITFTLPAVSSGQTGWLYSVDGGGKIALDNDQRTVFISDLAIAEHTFSLQAVSNEAVTLATDKLFDYKSMPERPRLNLRSSSVEFAFAQIPDDVTRLLLRIDGQDERVIETTVGEYLVSDLSPEVSHTYSLRYERMILGAPSFGAILFGSFSVMSTPTSPTINSTPTGLTITFPTPAKGQKFWNYSLNGAEFTKISTTVTSISLPALKAGNHFLAVQAGAEEGFSLEKITSFTVLAAPVAPKVNLRGTSTQFIFPATPTGVTSIMIQVNDLAIVRLAAASVEYYVNNLNLGEDYRFKIAYEVTNGTTKTKSDWTSVLFTPLKSPNQASVDATGSNMIVTLPAPELGQRVWVYALDGGAQVTVPVSTSTLTFDLPGLGAHSFEIFAGTDSALTLSKTTSFFKYAAPAMPVVNLRGTGTQLTFAAAPGGVSNIVIQVDNLTPVQLSPTTVEYWVNGLELGSSKTFSISYLYTNTYSAISGEKTSGNFSALKSSDPATIKVSSTEFTVTLPAVAAGQTGWRYHLDSESSIAIGIDTLKLSLTVPSVGVHSFNLQAVGGVGTTLAKSTAFTYLAAPGTVQANLSGTGTRMTFGAAPAGVTNLVVQVDDLAPVFLPISTTEYWVNNLEKGSNHVFKAWYRTVATGVTSDSAVKTVLFVPLSNPVAAAVTVSGNSALVTLPTAAVGQTGWLYAVDNELNYIAVEAGTATVIVGSLSTGTHRFYLKAVGKDGITGSSVKTFTIS